MEEILLHLAEGFAESLTPFSLAMIASGVVAGLFVGAMPGLGSVNGVAILLPVTFIVPPNQAIMFLGAIYYGAMYGGAISSVMLGIPGASTAVATTFDGRPLAQAGKAEQALITAAVGSFVGGTVSVVLFTLFAPPLAEFALSFGPPEEFTLLLVAFSTFVALGGESILKTLFTICLGLVLSAVGLDIVSGQPRLIFGDLSGFYHGIDFLVLAIGMYGIGEIMWTIENAVAGVEVSKARLTWSGSIRAFKSLRSAIGTLAMGSFLGYFVGILPAAGATPGSLMAYGVAKSMARDASNFGKGDIRGIAAPESANNAASTGSMLPMLTLGIPGSPTTAVLLGGMVIWGLRPGPLLFLEHPDFVWGLITSLYTANAMTFVFNVLFIPVFMLVLRMPFTILAPIIFVLCVVGGYAPTNTLHDVWLMLIFGLGGYVLRKLSYPVAPIVLAVVLGPLAERAVRQSLIGSQGSPMVFVERPLSAAFLVIAVVLFGYPLLRKYVIDPLTAEKAA